MRNLIIAALAASSLIGLSASATAHDDHHAHGAMSGAIEIVEPWARAMLPGQRTGGGYMTIANQGEEDDRLVFFASPVAGRTEIHSMEVVDDVMVMRPVEGGLQIPAGGTVALEPGGLHLMFMEVEEPFVEGEEVPLALEFEKAGTIEVTMPVRSARAGRGEHDHGHDHNHGHKH